jgi:UDP-2,3-diacylglucosamine pyrophosphatase LpxH
MPEPVIYFISDTHLGDGSGADRFLYPNELISLLARIEAEPAAHLVLLGDFLELWASSLESVLIGHAPIFRRLGQIAAKHPITYVVGNHDALPWYYFIGQTVPALSIAERFTTPRGLVAIHGHQYDPFNQIKVEGDGRVKLPWVEKLVQVMGFLGRVGGEKTGDAIADAAEKLGAAANRIDELIPHADAPARHAYGSMLHQVKGILERQSPGERGYPLGESAYEDAARSLMRAGARFVLMGHTHHPLVHHYGNRLYMNTGSWVWERYPPTYGRYAGGRLELIDATTHAPFAG